MTNYIEEMMKKCGLDKFYCTYCQYSEDIMTSRGSIDTFEHEFPIKNLLKKYNKDFVKRVQNFSADDWNNFIQKYGEKTDIGKIFYFPKFGGVSKVYIKYPNFTPEKQLEIIRSIGFYITEDEIYHKLMVDTDFLDNLGEESYYWLYNTHYGNDKCFSQALAFLITELIKEKEIDIKKVKEILQ